MFLYLHSREFSGINHLVSEMLWAFQVILFFLYVDTATYLSIHGSEIGFASLFFICQSQ